VPCVLVLEREVKDQPALMPVTFTSVNF
jgi:hypothetical protein